MTYSRSDNQTSRTTSPIDALNRTIEALEARLEGLMSEGGARRPGGQPSIETQERDAVALIRERQRQLNAFRSQAGRPKQAAPAPVERRADAAPSGDRPAAASEADSDLREVAQALVALRRELRSDIRRDLGEDIGRQFDHLRQELEQIRGLASRETMPDALKPDLARLTEGLDALRHERPSAALANVHADMEQLRELIDGLAREETVRGLDNRWAEICEMMNEIDPGAVRDEISALTSRLDEIRAAVALLPDAGWSRQMEAEAAALTGAVERLARQHVDTADLRHDIGHLNERLDEISQAIVAASTAMPTPVDSATMERIEGRLAQIGDRLGADGALGPRLDELAARLNTFAENAGSEDLARRIDALAERIAGGLPARDVPDIADHLDELTARIDDLNATLSAPRQMVGDDLLDRFEALVARAEESGASGSDRPQLGILQRQLEEITGRLDQANPAPAAISDDALRGLETQILNLSELINSRGPVASDGALAILEPRLAAIEGHLAHSQADVIAAATRAAESAVASFLESGVDDYEEGAGDYSAVAGLAEDLRSLEKLTRMSEERNARTFDALHDTLLKIADRLEAIDRNRGTRLGEAALMPAASMAAAVAGTQAVAADAPVEKISAEAPSGLPSSSETTSRSFIGKLAERMRPKRELQERTEPAIADTTEPRAELEPTPPIDPSDTLDAGAANEPLEPGSGTPDIGRILQKVREQQGTGVNSGSITYSESEKADFIAAARRAAQAAAAEVEASGRVQAGRSRKKSESGTSRRRPILIAVGAVLLALLSYPVVTGLLGEERPESRVATVSEPAEAVDTAALTMAEENAAAMPEARDTVEAVEQRTAEVEPPVTEPVIAETPPLAEMHAQSVLAEEPEADRPATSMQQASQPAPPAPAIEENAASAAQASAEEAGRAARVAALPDDIGTQALKDAAREGDALALFELGARYTEGRGVETDLTQAALWYRDAAENGFAPAQYRLGNFYEKGSGVERDTAEARRWYEAAAEQGNASAMHNLAVMHASGGEGVAPDYEVAADWFLDAAEHGVRDSQFNLAVLFARGSGVEQDLGQSYKWFAIAAREGDADAAAKRDEVANVMEEDELAEARAEVELWQPKPLDPQSNAVEMPEEWAVSETRTASVDTTQAIRSIQIILNGQGYDAGSPDGILGAKTTEAIRAFQRAEGLEPTGRMDDALVRALLESQDRG
jgi:localization factor PodJL